MKAPRITIKPGVPRYLDDDDNPSFDEWESRVDRIMTKYIGIGLHDLPDCPTREWYDDRVRPIRAANKALRYAEDF